MTGQEHTLNLLTEHEKAIGNQYQRFADRFPEYASLWSGCAQEEFLHVEIVHTMQALATKGTDILS